MLATPKQAAEAYDQIFESVAPRSARIVEDRTNIINSLKWIVKQKGSVVADNDLRSDFETGEPFKELVLMRNGHRRVAADAVAAKGKWGGSRKRKVVESSSYQRNIHPAARRIVKARMGISKAMHDNTKTAAAVAEMEGMNFKEEIQAQMKLPPTAGPPTAGPPSSDAP